MWVAKELKRPIILEVQQIFTFGRMSPATPIQPLHCLRTNIIYGDGPLKEQLQEIFNLRFFPRIDPI
jgi:hypothetical protein